MQIIFHQLNQILSAGEKAVLVIVADSRGSSPRGVGAAMLVTAQGRITGTIGGGLLEHRCTQRAQALLSSTASVLEDLRLEEGLLNTDMACGGQLQVFYRPFSSDRSADRELLKGICAALISGEPVWLVFQLNDDKTPGKLLHSSRQDSLIKKGSPLLRDHPVRLTLEGQDCLCLPLCPPGRVLIFGGGHVAQALVPILSAAEFRCVVMDDRKDFCRPDLFLGVDKTQLLCIEDATTYPVITKQDYVCIMTHGHKGDLTVQAHVLRTPARYIGVMGSRRKAQAAFAALRQMGFSEQDLGRIVTPIGLDIGADSPAEIAVSIAAQLISIRAKHL